jgi:trans-aconitate methyltransferase
VEHVAEVLVKRLELVPSDIVADLGCGTGRVATRLASHVGVVRAFDYSETVLNIARRRRANHNVTYHHADLNSFDPTPWGLTKAFSVASFYYMNGRSEVLGLIRRLNIAKISLAAVDLPDDELVDNRTRSYNQAEFTHLRLNAKWLLKNFPGGYVVRGEFPEYVNNRTRFNFYLPATGLDAGSACTS